MDFVCLILMFLLATRESKPKRVSKKHSCLYCGSLQVNIPRHMERKHDDEIEVREALKLPKGMYTSCSGQEVSLLNCLYLYTIV